MTDKEMLKKARNYFEIFRMNLINEKDNDFKFNQIFKDSVVMIKQIDKHLGNNKKTKE